MAQIDTKQVILEKALELFSSYGYHSVSVDQIAKAVGIKAPSLYNHYKSKQAIFDAIVEATAEQYKKDTEKLSVHMQDVNRDFSVFTQITENDLTYKVRQIFSYSLHNKTISRFRRMMTIEQFRSPQLAELYTKRYVDHMIKYHAVIFKNLIDAGVIRNENPNTLAMMYVAPIITLLGICDRQPDKEAECIEKLEEHVKLFYRAFHS